MGGAGLAAALWLLLLPPWVVAAGGAEYSALVNLTFVHPSTGQLVCEQVAAGGSAAGLGSRPGSASGQLVHVSGDACSALDTAAVPPREPWIALIQLGNCAEALKLRHAAAANASGAVLYYGAATAGHALFGTRRHKGGEKTALSPPRSRRLQPYTGVPGLWLSSSPFCVLSAVTWNIPALASPVGKPMCICYSAELFHEKKSSSSGESAILALPRLAAMLLSSIAWGVPMLIAVRIAESAAHFLTSRAKVSLSVHS